MVVGMVAGQANGTATGTLTGHGSFKPYILSRAQPPLGNVGNLAA